MNPAMSYPAAAGRPFTLNDLRLRSYAAEEPSSNSALTVSGAVLAVVLAIGAFVMLDPLALFAPSEVKPETPVAQSSAPPAEPARPAINESITVRPAAPAMKSIEVPVAPAPVLQAPAAQVATVQAPHAPASTAQQRSNSVARDSKTIPAGKTDAKLLKASPVEKPAPPVLLINPDEKAAPPVLLTKPEEKMEAPSAPKQVDDMKVAPKPAATSEQPAVKEEAN